jgi:hypothetical protein
VNQKEFLLYFKFLLLIRLALISISNPYLLFYSFLDDVIYILFNTNEKVYLIIFLSFKKYYTRNNLLMIFFDRTQFQYFKSWDNVKFMRFLYCDVRIFLFVIEGIGLYYCVYIYFRLENYRVSKYYYELNYIHHT